MAGTVDVAEGVVDDVECSTGLEALAERGLIEHVLGNLAENAAKHTDQGKITLAARSPANGFVFLQVRDTGSAIPTEEQERIFELCYGSDGDGREGFGLGLAIVRESVQALGGVVEVESNLGVGTTVRVILVGGGKRIS